MPTEVLDEELAEELRNAKKKPRNFAAIVKGSKVVKLIVKKKPIKQTEILEAKSESGGKDYYQGVCQGDGGAEIVFRLTGEEPTIKTVQFKEFIAQQTSLTIKPRFELVKELQEVDEQDGNEQPVPGANTNAGVVEQESNESDNEETNESANELAKQFKEKLASIKPKMGQVIAAGGEFAKQIQEAATEMASLAKSLNYSGALEAIVGIEKELNKLAAYFTDRLQGFKPDLDRALAAQNPLGAEIKQHASAMATAARQGNFAAAIACLDLAEPLVRKVLAGPSAKEEIASTGVDMAWVKECAKFAAARGVWVRIRDLAVGNIRTIMSNMSAEFKDDPENVQSLQAATRALEEISARFTDDLRQKFDEFTQDPPLPVNDRTRIRGEVLDLIAGYRQQVESNSLYEDLDQREFAAVLVKQPLLEALNGMSKDLAT